MKTLGRILVLVAILSACSAEIVDPDRFVVASDRLGDIGFTEVDVYLLSLDPEHRAAAGEELGERLAEAARQVAFERLIRAESADEDDLQAIDAGMHELHRRALSEAAVHTRTSAKSISDAELETRYQDRLDEFKRPERRELRHLFKRADPELEGAVAAASQLRQRILDGEVFSLLARHESDSESRHQDGLIGLVSPGQLSPELDDLVFALPLGEPSEVVRTADGAHVFLVERILDARDLDFEAARPSLLDEISQHAFAERRRELAEELLGEAPRPTWEELQGRLTRESADAVIFRHGDFEITAAELVVLIRERQVRSGPKQLLELPRLTFEELRDDEIIVFELSSRGELPELDPETAAALEREIERRGLDRMIVERLRSYLEESPALVKEFHARNRQRFSTPLLLELSRLAVPKGSRSTALMAKLEASRPLLDRGELDLSSLAELLGGRVDELGLVAAAQLELLDPRGLRFALELADREHSPPYQFAGQLIILRLERRVEPEPLPLAEVRTAVIETMIETQGPLHFSDLRSQLLEASGFELDQESLARVVTILGSAS